MVRVIDERPGTDQPLTDLHEGDARQLGGAQALYTRQSDVSHAALVYSTLGAECHGLRGQ